MSRGSTVLPAALAAVAVSTALGAAVAELTRVEVVIARHRRVATAALVATDACLAEVVDALPPEWDFAAALAGPDGIPGTADDGTIATPAGCTGAVVAAPPPAAPPRAIFRLEASASGGRRVVDALVGRDAAAGVPALVWLDGPPPPDPIAGRIALDGADPADPSAADWSGVAAGVDPALLDRWLGDHAGAIAASPRTAPAIFAPSPPFAALRDRLRTAGAADVAAMGAAPTLMLADGDLAVPGALAGAGLLLVAGRLDIDGLLDFTGVVIASGGLHVGPGGRLAVRGAVWTAGPLGIDGTLDVRHDGAAVAGADALLPLPRRAVLLGLRDLG